MLVMSLGQLGSAQGLGAMALPMDSQGGAPGAKVLPPDEITDPPPKPRPDVVSPGMSLVAASQNRPRPGIMTAPGPVIPRPQQINTVPDIPSLPTDRVSMDIPPGGQVPGWMQPATQTAPAPSGGGGGQSWLDPIRNAAALQQQQRAAAAAAMAAQAAQSKSSKWPWILGAVVAVGAVGTVVAVASRKGKRKKRS